MRDDIKKAGEIPDIRNKSDKLNDEIEDAEFVYADPIPADANPLDEPLKLKNKMKVIPTERELQYVERLVSLGLPQKYQAAFLNLSLSAYTKMLKANPDIRDRLRNVEAKVLGNVAKTAYDLAVSGESPAMTMFYLKTRAGWREKQHVELEGSVKLEDIVAPTFKRIDNDKKNDNEDTEE